MITRALLNSLNGLNEDERLSVGSLVRHQLDSKSLGIIIEMLPQPTTTFCRVLWAIDICECSMVDWMKKALQNIKFNLPQYTFNPVSNLYPCDTLAESQTLFTSADFKPITFYRKIKV